MRLNHRLPFHRRSLGSKTSGLREPLTFAVHKRCMGFILAIKLLAEGMPKCHKYLAWRRVNLKSRCLAEWSKSTQAFLASMSRQLHAMIWRACTWKSTVINHCLSVQPCSFQIMHWSRAWCGHSFKMQAVGISTLEAKGFMSMSL